MNGAKARNASAATQTFPPCQTTTPGNGAVRRWAGNRRSAKLPCKDAKVKAFSGTSARNLKAIHCTLRWQSTQGPSKNTTADVVSVIIPPKMRHL